jgi:pyruvate formate lyase activating enzyme
MVICGLHKTTLIDYPGKIACVVFLHGCNFRCGFCHNPELVTEACREENEISEEEFFAFLDKRKGQLEGVCITGGEPLVRMEEDFLKKIKERGYLVKLDTNGTFPDKLRRLLEKGLVDFVAMDIKADRDNYDKVTNVRVDLTKIEDSIKTIVNHLDDYEFRTTIVKGIHDIEVVKNIGLWLNSVLDMKPKKYVLQGFKNKGKLLDAQFKMKKDVEEGYLIALKESVEEYFEDVEIRV